MLTTWEINVKAVCAVKARSEGNCRVTVLLLFLGLLTAVRQSLFDRHEHEESERAAVTVGAKDDINRRMRFLPSPPLGSATDRPRTCETHTTALICLLRN